MLNKLKQHWEVQTKELVLILCTFAITGSLTAWLSKKVAEWLLLDKYGLAWWMSKIIILVFGYQVIILIVGFCFGMFSFFWKYEKKILARLGFFKNQSLEYSKAGLPLPGSEHKEYPGKSKNLQMSSDQPDHIDGLKDDDNQSNTLLNDNLLEHSRETIHQISKKYRIAIFASGAGSNALKIIQHFKQHIDTEIALLVCNNQKAGVISIAEGEGIPVLFINKSTLNETGYVPELLKEQIDLVVLAGFLWQIPPVLIRAFPKRIINIHPSLLPAYGGKGMYGNAVHEAVLNSKDIISGITIHYVDEIYDHGEIIFQQKITIESNETVESLKDKIHLLEHKHFALEIEKLIKKIKNKDV